MRSDLSRLLLVMLLSMAALLGCGNAATNKGMVHGQVTFAGKPVSDGTIRFEGPAGVSENADLDGEGKYQVRSHLGAGLPSGVYRVAVLPRVAVRSDSPPLAGAAPPEDPTKEFPHIPPKFRNIETSELKIEVQRGANPPFDFDLSQ